MRKEEFLQFEQMMVAVAEALGTTVARGKEARQQEEPDLGPVWSREELLLVAPPCPPFSEGTGNREPKQGGWHGVFRRRQA